MFTEKIGTQLTDDNFERVAKRLGLSEKKLIEALVKEGWTMGRSKDNKNEFHRPTSNK